ncbi:YqeG family HAD IIIA-type phosphatase [Salsuginibacillus kocurii]|uniref:YqeG family HAD IIIA-type phosphatase n=1 Tax=Salsuginibacillus kocurii TaxID=427078 RepID=UPI00036B4F5A|nr:YqeG family HAD IIIA-type phosphatase [Salsuginibacillus kocurii]
MITYFMPNEHVTSIYDIDLQELKDNGYKAIITDLDNTLVEWDRPEATPEVMEWLQTLYQEGFKITVVSNNHETRVRTFSETAGLTFIHSAKKPSRRAFKKACQLMEVKEEEAVVVGDQLLTDVLGGNRGGFYTILVVPVASTDGVFTKLNRKIERRVLKRMEKKGYVIERKEHKENE